MPKIPGVNHLRAVRALEKARFRIVSQGKHVVMSEMKQPPTRMTRSGSGSRMNRREVLAAGLGGLVGVLGRPRRTLAQDSLLGYPFSLSVASGEPLPDGVVLWTRLAPDPFHGGGMRNRPFAVRWEIAADDRMQRVLRQGEALARPELGHSVHVEVSGLEPAREYWYRFNAGGEASPIGRTRTAPAPGASVGRLRFGVAGCQAYEQGYYTAYRHLAEEQLDFVFHYGDYIYESRSYADGARELPEPADETYSLEGYRNRYAAYKADPDLQAAHRSAPFVVSFDDHEVDDNWAGEVARENVPPEVFLLRRAAAFQAYYEHMPLRLSSLPQGSRMSMYRQFRFGDLAAVNVLDTRQYRTDQPCGDGNRTDCADALDPARTMLGTSQESWLFDRLRGSQARWNVLAQQVMMMRTDYSEDEDVVLSSMDKWDGAVAARQRLLDFLERNEIANPVVLTGDIHRNFAGELKTDFADENSATVGCEFVATSISSGGDGTDQTPLFQALLAQNPYVKFHNDQRGYLSIEVSPDLWLTHFRVVDYVSRPGAALRTRATYVVENGIPALDTA